MMKRKPTLKKGGSAIPGGKNNAKEVAKLAKVIYSRLAESGEILP